MNDKAFDFTRANGETYEKNETVNNHEKSFYKQHSSSSINGKTYYNKQFSNKSDDFSSYKASDSVQNDYSDFINEMYDRYPNTKWPLHNSWTFWVCNTNQSEEADWSQNTKKIADFSTIEDFWCIFNYLQDPSKLDLATELIMFKTGILPTWDDPKNKNQGRWYLSIPPNDTLLNQIWMNSVLALIGDQLCGNEANSNSSVDDHICHGICGVRVQKRSKFNRIAIWTTDCHNEKLTRAIGQRWKENLESNNQFGYLLHEGKTKECIYEIEGKSSFPDKTYFQQKKQYSSN